MHGNITEIWNCPLEIQIILEIINPKKTTWCHGNLHKKLVFSDGNSTQWIYSSDLRGLKMANYCNKYVISLLNNAPNYVVGCVIQKRIHRGNCIFCTLFWILAYCSGLEASGLTSIWHLFDLSLLNMFYLNWKVYIFTKNNNNSSTYLFFPKVQLLILKKFIFFKGQWFLVAYLRR